MAFDAMLLMSGVSIDMLQSVEFANFFENNIRGGTSFIGVRHCEQSDGPDDPRAHAFPHSEERLQMLLIGEHCRINNVRARDCML